MESINKQRFDEIVNLIFKVANGDYSVQIPLSGFNDELDSLAMGFNMMVDELKVKLSQIQKQNDYTNKIISHISDSLFVLNPDKTIKLVNNAAAQLLDSNKSDLTGRAFKDFVVEPERTFVDLGVSKDFFQNIETTFVTGNENYIPVLLSCSILKSDGEIESIICIAHDITRIKTVERELIKAKEKAEEINKLKSSFLSTMGHELRTPLFGILGYTEILQKEAGHAEDHEIINAIHSNGRRLMDTLDAILKYSRIESEQTEDYLVPINPVAVIQKHLNTFKELSVKKSLNFISELCNDDFMCLIDEGLFTQVIFNLVENAIKFTKWGRVKILTGLTQDNKIFQVKVIDTGIGIKKEHQTLIFEDFRQVSEGLTRNYEGAGLGLTITKRYVEIMRGRIFVESEYGKGSIFTVLFPVQ